MSIYDTFRSFLRANNCEGEFSRNFFIQCGSNRFDSTLADIMVIDESFVARCFDWTRTPEGRDYWKNIDALWWKTYLARK